MSKRKSNAFNFVPKKVYAEQVVILSTGQLRKAIRAFQKDDAAAAELLRKSYFALIYSIAHRESVYRILGEDAENEIWCIFFSLVKDYRSNKFKTFPTNIKMLLELRVVNLIKHYYTKAENEINDSDNTLTAKLPAPDEIDKTITNMALASVLEQLSDFDKEIIKYCFFSGLPRKQIAEHLRYSERQLRRYKEDVLAKLKRKLNK